MTPHPLLCWIEHWPDRESAVAKRVLIVECCERKVMIPEGATLSQIWSALLTLNALHAFCEAGIHPGRANP